MWTSGVALHLARACGHRFRGRIVPFSDPAASRIPIPASKHHAPHPQRSVRVKHQGECIYLVFPVGYHALIQTFLIRSVSASPTVRSFSLTKHTPFDSTFTQITRNCGNLHGECGPVRDTLDWNHALFLRVESDHSLAIIGLQGFFPLKGQAAMGVGALEVPTSERKRLAGL